MNMSLRITLSAGLLLAALSSTRPAQAFTTFCVGDVTHLNAALQHARSASDTTVIQLVAGTWNVGNSELTAGDISNPFQAVKLLGGYDSTCSNRTLIPTNTVVDGGGQTIDMFAQGSLTFEGLFFQNTVLYVDEYSVNGTSTVVRNNVFSGAPLAVAYRCSDNGAIDIDNNLASGASTGIEVQTFCYDSNSSNRHAVGTDSINLTNNTVVGNGATGIQIDSSAVATLYNNVSWGNGQHDVYLRTGQLDQAPSQGTAYASDNSYGNFSGFEAAGSSGSLFSDPLFVNAGSGDYHLQANSPAVNTGNASAPSQSGVDLDGNPRVVGSAPDRGVYESNVNDTASTTIVVTNIGDSGPGSLRQAITDANASGGTHYIEFNINDGGSCPWVINLASDLPYVTAPGLSINGFTQPGSKANNIPNDLDDAKRCIVLNGQNRNSSMGLTFYGAASGFYWVQGLAFEGFGIGLNLSAGQNNLVWGNQFGGNLWYGAGSMPLSSNAIDIWLCGGSTTTTVGGTDPSNRNIIDSASNSNVTSPQPNYDGRGIAISSAASTGCGSGGNSIVNNIIGLDNFESTTSYGNAIGIQIETANNKISGNVIGNNNNGIQLLGSGASGNEIFGNLIGISEPLLCVLSPCPPPNAEPNQAGIYFWQGAYGNLVVSNTITNNSLFGVELINAGTYQNLILANSIYGNPASWAALSSDSTREQVNLDSYAYSTTYGLYTSVSAPPNDYLNYPIVNRAVGSSSRGTIAGSLAATNGTYSIAVYSSPTCEAGGAFAHSPWGATLVSGQDSVHHVDGSGTFSFDFTSPISLTSRYITATAIDSNGDTSEFSPCKLYQCDVIFRHGFDTAKGEKCP